MMSSLPARFLTIILILCCAASEAAGVPVLRDTAKQRPAVSQALRTTVADPADTGTAWISLGRYNDISAIKKRIVSRRHRNMSRWSILRRISARSVMVMDAETGETLFARAPDKPRQPASTIKVLTGMIAIKSLKDTDHVAVSRHAARMPRSKIYLDPRKRYPANDLINAVLLASANDASVALAEKIAGSEKNFAKMMTLRARLWGATRTICRTATGLTARGQHSTARDLATIFRHAMLDSEFVKRMRRTRITTSWGQTLYNHNKALWRVKGAEGGKTGYTAAARQTYVGKFTRESGSIIVAIMGSETMWSDIKNLVEYGFQRKEEIARARTTETRLARAD